MVIEEEDILYQQITNFILLNGIGTLAFIALGYSYFNLNFALKEINTLLDGQWKDGMVPHILFHNTKTNYYPNYTAWNCGNKIHSSGITQPPILATILKEILDKNKINKKQF